MCCHPLQALSLCLIYILAVGPAALPISPIHPDAQQYNSCLPDPEPRSHTYARTSVSPHFQGYVRSLCPWSPPSATASSVVCDATFILLFVFACLACVLTLVPLLSSNPPQAQYGLSCFCVITPQVSLPVLISCACPPRPFRLSPSCLIPIKFCCIRTDGSAYSGTNWTRKNASSPLLGRTGPNVRMWHGCQQVPVRYPCSQLPG